MPKYLVSAVKTIYLETVIEAENEYHAEAIADQELITDDFREVSTNFMLDPIMELEEAN